MRVGSKVGVWPQSLGIIVALLGPLEAQWCHSLRAQKEALQAVSPRGLSEDRGRWLSRDTGQVGTFLRGHAREWGAPA